MTVFEFMYSDCIYESGPVTLSLHKTREGAERAMQIHREHTKKEWDEMYKPEDQMGEYDNMKSWSVVETKVLE